MRKNRNRNRKAGKDPKPKSMSSATAAGPEATRDPVSEGGTGNFMTEQSGADGGTPAMIADVAASLRADNEILEAWADPSRHNDGASQAQIEADPAGQQMQVHPLAEIFPLPSEEDLHNLAADIKQNGLLEPITTFQGMILDGRCRNLACQLASAELKFVEYADADPVGYVLSKNVRRRHLTESQRAMVAAKLADRNVGANQYTEGVPIGRAAKLLNVSERSVARAKEVLRLGDLDLTKDVESGRMRVSVAAKKCRAPGSVQDPSEAGQQGDAEIESRAQTLHSDHKLPRVDDATTSASSSSGEHSSKMPLPTETMPAAAGPSITPGESGSNVAVGAAVDAGAEADEAAFARLTTAWDAASDSARHRFVLEVVKQFGQLNVAA